MKIKTTKDIYLKDWEHASYELGEHFATKYFGKDNDAWWVGDEYGGVLAIGDYFFNMRDVTDFIRYNYTRKMMFEYYDMAMEYHMKNHKKSDYLVNIRNYKYLK